MQSLYRVEATMPNTPDDDLVEDVLHQVTEVLRGFQLDGDETRDAIRDGLRQALGVLDPSPAPAPVVVLDGGRADDDAGRADDDAAQAPADKPDLRVAEPPADEHVEPTPSVEVFSVGSDILKALRGPSLFQADSAHGKIWLGGGDTDWQTVFRGADAHAYRLCCDEGGFDVAIDGVVVDRVNAGRSIDVSAPLIRVRSADALPARGTYRRV